MKFVPGTLALAAMLYALPAFGQVSDSQLQADVQHQLNKKQFRDVHAQIASGAVTLTGSVTTLADKLDAVKRVDKTHEAATIQDQITVDTPQVSDEELMAKLGKKLAYDRLGYPSYPFNAIGLQVQNGIAEVSGEVVDPVDKDSAIDIVAGAPGVRGLVDHLKVAPVSPNDWSIRRSEYQAVYGSSVSTKYAIDPAKPIRIVVDHGHVTLYGTVLNTGDREIIAMRANAVPGAFSVQNNLQVQGQGGEVTH